MLDPIEVPTLEDERVFVTFTVPMKGRKPFKFKLPRFDFLPPDDIKALMDSVRELDKDEELASSEEPGAIERASTLTQFKPHVTAQQLKTLETLSIGQLRFIRDKWYAQSAMPLGESLASVDSLESTERPSNTISSAEDGDAMTSVAV